MPERQTEILEEIASIEQRSASSRLVAQGLARNFIWREGVLPTPAPRFTPELTARLLDYGYLLTDRALDALQAGVAQTTLAPTFLAAAEAMEAACRRGDREDNQRPTNLLVAACSYEMAGHGARAFCLMEEPGLEAEYSGPNRLTKSLLRRDFNNLRNTTVHWLSDAMHTDVGLAQAIGQDEGISLEDALEIAIKRQLFTAHGLFDSGLLLGNRALADAAAERLTKAQSVARDVAYVPLWWNTTWSIALQRQLWAASLHNLLPATAQGSPGWADLRQKYIALNARKPTLWPSQFEAAARAVNPLDDLVVTLPTSAGKTRVSEMCILRALADGKRVIYITPLRALSAQQERTLGDTFRPLGFTVSSLYGASGITSQDLQSLRAANVVVATPEKLDFGIRADPSLLDDVGLVVLDEGHMIGIGSREVRYEVLVQRLLRRPDAGERRIVCLSAIFSPNEEFNDFTAWIRGDSPGTAVSSNWSPTRRLIGTVTWTPRESGRLEIRNTQEAPFVQDFIVKERPGGRTKPFPADDAELTAATMRRLASEGHSVLVYTPRRSMVETFAKKCIALFGQGILPSYLKDPAKIKTANRLAAEWLGADHPASQALRIGIAVHHGAMPPPFRAEIERLVADRTLPIVIASPSLAQGVDLSCTALVFRSIYAIKDPMDAANFHNVVGRVGRAMRDVEGLVLYPIFGKPKKKTRDFLKLIQESTRRELGSGILELIDEIARQLHLTPEAIDRFVDLSLNLDTAWNAAPSPGEPAAPMPLENLLEDLDGAILASIESLDIPANELAQTLDESLRSSLWRRHLARRTAADRAFQEKILKARGQWIWRRTSTDQRKAFHAAGLGYVTGSYLSRSLAALTALVRQAADALEEGNPQAASEAIAELHKIVAVIHTFKTKLLPANWRAILAGWVSGEPMSSFLGAKPSEAVMFVQESLVYRLVWATEAIRAQNAAEGQADITPQAQSIQSALTYGVPTLYAAFLLDNGLASRRMAMETVQAVTPNTGETAREWANRVVQTLDERQLWPDRQDQTLWIRFLGAEKERDQPRWADTTSTLDVEWFEDGAPGRILRIVRNPANESEDLVCNTSLQPVGRLRQFSPGLAEGIVTAKRLPSGQLEVQRFGPPLRTA